MEQTPLFLASFSSFIIIITPKTPHSFTPTSYYKMSNNNNNEKEREKAKQKNIAVIENAIAARNKVLMLLLLCSFLFVYLNKSSHFSKINFSLLCVCFSLLTLLLLLLLHHHHQYKSIADDRVREIAKLEKQIVSLEALMDPRTNKDGMDALKIKLAECEGTIAALRLEIASVRGKLDKKSKAASSSDDDISSSNALSKLAQLAGSAAGSAGFGSGFNSRDYLLGVVSGMALLGVLVSVNHHRSGGTVSLRWFGETVSALLKTSTTSSAK
tara:strand:+ start:8352 stop:9161 length:810 start_codon:yes stop_codon:yes gene_type:complete